MTNTHSNFYFINKAKFTKSHTPLNYTDDEQIHYFHPEASFYLLIGTGIPVDTQIFRSFQGILFVTTHRIVYKVTDKSAGFDSFYVPVLEIQSVDVYSVQFIYDGYVRDAIFTFKDGLHDVFINAVDNVCQVARSKWVETEHSFGESDELPFYSDFLDTTNKEVKKG